ncbi:hypothetical protein DMUE_2197 [Dictyocoela muelleri]|nr:hypothetical protein DMUE_2197 [Dictyocoela muelleri]
MLIFHLTITNFIFTIVILILLMCYLYRIETSFNINELRLNMACEYDTFKKIMKIDLSNKYYHIISQFDNEILKNTSSSDINKIIDQLGGLVIHFNEGNKWDINFMSQKSDYHTIFVFYLNDEQCVLYLNKEDLKKFLTDDFFENFVIPKDINIVIEKNNDENIQILSSIQPIYWKIYKQKPGYHRNIRHIFELIRGLFNISLKTPNYRIFDMKFKMFPGERLDLYIENQAYIRKLKKLKEFKTTQFDNVYTMMASQYISGQIYFHHFNEFIKNKKIKLSDNLMNIFAVFDNNYKNDIHELIKSMFLNIEIPKNVIIKNVDELNEIYNLLISIQDYIENYTHIKDKKSSLNNILEKLKRIIEDKSMSPIAVQRIIKYYDYCNIEENDFDQEFSTKLLEAKKFNKIFQKNKIKLILDATCESGRKFENFVKNIIQRNPNDLENPKLSCKEYEKIYPYIYRSDFMAFRIYLLLERMLTDLLTGGNHHNIKKNIDEINDLMGSRNYDSDILSQILEVENNIPNFINKNNQKNLLCFLFNSNSNKNSDENFDSDENFNFDENYNSDENSVSEIYKKILSGFHYSFEDETFFRFIHDNSSYLGNLQNLNHLKIKNDLLILPENFSINNLNEDGIITIIADLDI